jgi:hypothetical protein
MDEVLTISEIEAKFESEWVLLEAPRTDESLEVQGGTVRWHDLDHGRPLFDSSEKHALRMLNGLQFRVRPEA